MSFFSRQMYFQDQLLLLIRTSGDEIETKARMNRLHVVTVFNFREQHATKHQTNSAQVSYKLAQDYF